MPTNKSSKGFREFIRASREKYRECQPTIEILDWQPKKKKKALIQSEKSIPTLITIFTQSGHKFILPKNTACLSK